MGTYKSFQELGNIVKLNTIQPSTRAVSINKTKINAIAETKDNKIHRIIPIKQQHDINKNNDWKSIEVHEGELWYANLGTNIGRVQSYKRPVIIVSNEVCNKYSPVITVVSITSQIKNVLPTHVILKTSEGVDKESTVLCEQIISLDKIQLLDKVCNISSNKLEQIKEAMEIQINRKKQIQKINEDDYINAIFDTIFDIDDSLEMLEHESKMVVSKLFNAKSRLQNQLESYCKDNKIDYNVLLEIKEENKIIRIENIRNMSMA